MPGTGITQAEYLRRYAEYCEARDAGENGVDAANRIGLSDGTRQRFERSWKRLHSAELPKSNRFMGGWSSGQARQDT